MAMCPGMGHMYQHLIATQTGTQQRAQGYKEQRRGKKTFLSLLHCMDQHRSPPETCLNFRKQTLVETISFH